jgi:hypothetical protein
LPGGGRHLTDATFNSDLVAWVRGQRAKNLRVSRRIIQQQALKTFKNDEEDGISFKVCLLL